MLLGPAVVLLIICALLSGIFAQTARSSSMKARHVTRAQFGKAWPLTVGSGTLSCVSPPFPGAVTFTAPNGRTYWVNGTAGNIASQQGWRDIRPIWAKVKHPLFPGQRKDIGALIDAGLRLCR